MKRKSRHQRPVPTAARATQAKTQPEPAPAPKLPPMPEVPEELQGFIAGVMLSPEMSAAQSMHPMMDVCFAEAGIGLPAVNEMLKDQGQAVADGDLARVRRSLAAQEAALERMFHYLFRCATVAQKHSQDLFERYLRLAFRAQGQAVRTAHVLGRLGLVPAKQKPKEAPAAQPRPEKPAAATATAPSPAPSAVRTATSPAPPKEAFQHPVELSGWRWRPGGSSKLLGLSAATR